jgi:hypothetical protein
VGGANVKFIKGEKMTVEQISEFQLYLQMYDKGMISKKTILEKIDIDPEDEAKQIKKEYDELQQQFQTPNVTPSSASLGIVGGAVGSNVTEPY